VVFSWGLLAGLVFGGEREHHFFQLVHALLKRSVKIQPDIGAKKQEEITN
jgi:hypothetical protein